MDNKELKERTTYLNPSIFKEAQDEGLPCPEYFYPSFGPMSISAWSSASKLKKEYKYIPESWEDKPINELLTSSSLTNSFLTTFIA